VQRPEWFISAGVSLQRAGRLEEAVAVLRQGTALWPTVPELRNSLGILLGQLQRLDEAVAQYEEALRMRPAFVEAENNLGVALRRLARLAEAESVFRRAITRKGDFAEGYNGLGNVLRDQGRLDEARLSFETAISIAPRYPRALSNLGATLADLGRLDEALAAFRRALELDPRLLEAHNNLGNAYRDRGRVDDALASYRRALEIDPGFIAAHQNLLYAAHFDPAATPETLLAAHREWSRRFAADLAPRDPRFDNDPNPDRRLRVGYVSPDLRTHPVGRFALPLFAHGDRSRFELHVYTDHRGADSLTDSLREHCHGWRITAGQSDGAVAELIRQDRIDVLVDLTMHLAGSRLLVFARRPAPVQITYLAYCSTTGLDAIDYRLTDPYLDPPQSGNDAYAERSIRLPATYWCYLPIPAAPDVDAPPAAQTRIATFGCLNSPAKITAPTLEAWTRLLERVPASRLLLHLPSGEREREVRERLAERGIDPARLTVVPRTSTDRYLATYAAIDVALDPFPYGGGTTTCDALWMGVPVVTLRGDTAVGRGGASILSNVGLADLIAENVEGYVGIAAALAGDLPRLAALRAGMRARMQRSPLMDAARFAADVESAYRTAWRAWCQTRAGVSEPIRSS
jgi:predicted O-linked N-acetylglucosamine transferase (SPINDLY family)